MPIKVIYLCPACDSAWELSEGTALDDFTRRCRRCRAEICRTCAIECPECTDLVCHACIETACIFDPALPSRCKTCAMELQ